MAADSPIIIILLVFGIYRAARMIAEEEGPWSVLARLRGAVDPDQQTWVGRGVNCALCIGFWLALPLAIAAAPSVWALPFYWFGLAGGAAFLYRIAP